MTCNPLQVVQGSLMSEAVALMAQRKISELPVVDGDGRPVGLIDVTRRGRAPAASQRGSGMTARAGRLGHATHRPEQAGASGIAGDRLVNVLVRHSCLFLQGSLALQARVICHRVKSRTATSSGNRSPSAVRWLRMFTG